MESATKEDSMQTENDNSKLTITTEEGTDYSKFTEDDSATVISHASVFQSAFDGFTSAGQKLVRDFQGGADSTLKAKGIDMELIASDLRENAKDINSGAAAASRWVSEGWTAASSSLTQLISGQPCKRSPSPVDETIAIEVEYIEEETPKE